MIDDYARATLLNMASKHAYATLTEDQIEYIMATPDVEGHIKHVLCLAYEAGYKDGHDVGYDEGYEAGEDEGGGSLVNFTDPAPTPILAASEAHRIAAESRLDVLARAITQQIRLAAQAGQYQATLNVDSREAEAIRHWLLDAGYAVALFYGARHEAWYIQVKW